MKRFPCPPLWSVGVLVLLVLFGWAARQVWSRARPARDGEVTLRIAHWQLEAGVQRGLDAVAAEFEARNPGVKIEILRIPERVYPQWLITQFVGGTAPDLIELRMATPVEQKVRYLELLGEVVEAPNPYNAGTPLADVPWRETFVDGMRGGFDEALGDHFGAPAFLSTVRLFYNRRLLRDITGGEEAPRTLAELLDLCDRTEAWSRRENRPILSIAGSSYNAPYLFDALMRAQLHRMGNAFSPRPRLNAEAEAFFAAHLRGDWTFEHPDVRRTLALQREFGRHMQPGFLQLRREDATFAFTQQRALMIATGSWDATSLREECDFPVGVVAIPAPTADDPKWGEGVLGKVSEEGTGAFGPFGIARASKHPELALSFLQFLTSQEANRLFSRLSGWLPVIDGVDAPEDVEPFMPALAGYPGAPSLRYGIEAKQAYERNLHALFSPSGGVDAFIAQTAENFRAGVEQDLRRSLRSRERMLRQTDSVFEGWRQLERIEDSEEARRRRRMLGEAQIDQEIEAAWLRWELGR